MFETLLAAGIALCMLVPALVGGMLELSTVLWGSIWLLAIGFAGGLPPTVVYHARLARVLRSRRELPKNWYWNPTALHNELSPIERRHVLPWFMLGGIGFCAVALGTAGLIIAIMRLAATA